MKISAVHSNVEMMKLKLDITMNLVEPDEWETARGLQPDQDDSAADRDGDGYTNVEEYVNGLAAG